MNPLSTRISDHPNGSIQIGCAIAPIAPQAAKAAKARMCPDDPINRGALQHPMKNPMKWAEPRRPICVVLNPDCAPLRASSGPIAPDESCRNMTDRNRAAKDRARRMSCCYHAETLMRIHFRQDRGRN